MPGGAGGIPRGGITDFQLPGYYLKHPSRRGNLKKPYFGITSPLSGCIKSISPVLSPLFTLPSEKNLSKALQELFLNIILCLKQEFSPPWVKKLGASLFLAVTQGIRSISLPQTMLGLLIGFSSHCNSLYHLFLFFSRMTHPSVTEQCHWDANPALETQPEQLLPSSPCP